MSNMILDTAEKIFARDANAVARPTFDAGHWSEVEASGFTLALMGEDAGGFGLSALDATSILRVSAKHASRLPLGETMLCNWLLADAGLPMGEGAATVAFVDCLPKASSQPVIATRVPWAKVANTVAAITRDGNIGIFKSPRLLKSDANLAGEPRDDIELAWSAELPMARAPRSFDSYLALCALLRVAGLAGSAESVLRLTLDYANDRVQFGRPIGRNQVIQHQLAIMASHSAASSAAADMAANAFSLVLANEDRFKAIVASAKIRTGEAAGICASIAHQVHGAIGFTKEYRLHNLTEQLWSWRDEYGNEAFWSEQLANQMFAMSTPSAWRFLTWG